VVLRSLQRQLCGEQILCDVRRHFAAEGGAAGRRQGAKDGRLVALIDAVERAEEPQLVF